MSGQQDDRAPKTLADVSHLFFSKGDASDETTTGQTVSSREAEAFPAEQGRWNRTAVIPVTGGGRPGVSTIAVNLAHALLPWGRVGLFDADPRLPNARFYLGMSSSDYLGHLSGGGPSPFSISDGGLVVGDWAARGAGPDAGGSGEALYVDISGTGRRALDIAVVDIPLNRLGLLTPILPLVAPPVLVVRPDFSGFVEGYVGASAVLAAGLPAPLLVVNGGDESSDSTRFSAKMSEACERLLDTEIRFVGAVRRESRLGSRQRERGPIVRSEPDSIAALSLREVAANVLAAARGDDSGTTPAHAAVSREEQS